MNNECKTKCATEYLKENPTAKDKFGASVKQHSKQEPICEHELKLVSRTTGKTHEVGFGPMGGNLVPKNPFASIAQQGYLHAHPEKLGAAKLAEFDKASKGLKLPKRVKK